MTEIFLNINNQRNYGLSAGQHAVLPYVKSKGKVTIRDDKHCNTV